MQPRITQVPPRRYSSATMTRAPCWAAMRAARTPPDPPPITKRSTSYSAMSDIVTAPLHFCAHFGNDVVGELVAPVSGVGHACLKRLRLLDNELAADRRLIERQNIPQFRFGEIAGIDARARIYQFVDPGRVLPLQVGCDFVEVLGIHE